MKRTTLILGLVAVLSGCERKQPQAPPVETNLPPVGPVATPSNNAGWTAGASVTKQTLSAFFFDQGVTTSILPDLVYACPNTSWLGNGFSRALLAQQQAQGLTRSAYVDPPWNCNKYSRYAADFAAVQFYKANPGSQAALAFGVFYYIKSTGAGHAINCAVVRNGDELRLVFYEPQATQFIGLTKKEIQGGTVVF